MSQPASVFLSLAIFLTISFSGYAESNKDSGKKSPHEAGELYIDSDQQTKDIDNTLAKAKANNKLALIVMGANWCHDSRSLARKLFMPEIKSVIDENYELLFVDVGYLTKIKTVITRFGMPVIYATPTVLVIDPVSGKRINGLNMHIWRDADKVSIADTKKYFSEMANQKNSYLNPLANMSEKGITKLASLNSSIDEFEQTQADRIYQAFSVIGPLIKEKKEGGKAKDFMKHWKAVAALRYKITDDLSTLRQQASDIANDSSSNKQLTFPEYPAFEWEEG